MNNKVTKLECPNCSAKGEKEIAKRICVSQHPELKEDILNGSFFEWECPNCKDRFFIEDVFLYNDDENKFMIYLISGYDERFQEVPTLLKTKKEYDTDNSILRVTSSFIEFVEKIRILQAGLDDRVIETVKAVYSQVYYQSHKENVYNMIFERVDENNNLVFAVILQESEFAAEIPIEAYEQTKTDFTPLYTDVKDDAFVMIDQTWLVDVLKNKNLTD